MPTPEAQVQSAGFLLELSPDWLILRASENAHGFLGEYHQRLVGEPLGGLMLAQSLHDLRNSLSRQRSSNGIAHAYRVRLIDEPRYFDIAFQSLDGSILLEGLPSSESGFGEWLGAVSRLLAGLQRSGRKEVMDDAARRMRALTGFDHVTLSLGEERVESNRGRQPAPSIAGELPPIVADSSAQSVLLFPRSDEPIQHALLRAPAAELLDQLQSAGVKSALRVPVVRAGETIGEFRCYNRAVQPPSFEQHAAAGLFAQMFGMILPD